MSSAIIGRMILVTGGTGFIGRLLVRQLVGMGYQVRTLLRPSSQSPKLPLSVPVEVVVCSLKDERGLRAAMRGVEVVFHLAGAERQGSRADLQGVDIEGSRFITQAAADANVNRLVFLSHLGADRASAYPVLKAKGIAERLILQSQVPSTIFRSAVAFGPGDHFTTSLIKLMRISPFVFILPGDGNTNLQPLWVEDLVTAMILSVEDSGMANQIFAVGGPEFLTYRKITETVASAAKVQRRMISISPAYLRILAVWLEHSWKDFPMSIFWQDYLAADRTCELDTLPRLFGLMPERFGHRLDYILA
jgi:uncharacterized protein YbjT (DUF2867 family)